MGVYNNIKVLLVDADLVSCKVIKSQISIKGYLVIVCTNAKKIPIIIEKEQPDLIILEALLPQIDGYTLCINLRKEAFLLPIIFLTTSNSVSERILGFKVGADDFISKPFYLKELDLRIQSILKRIRTFKLERNHTLNIGNINIDITKREVYKTCKKINLTKIEFAILEILISKIGEILPRTFILNKVWGYVPERHSDTRIVDVHISRLRSKIENNPSNPDLIVTKWGEGYMFNNFQK